MPTPYTQVRYGVAALPASMRRGRPAVVTNAALPAGYRKVNGKELYEDGDRWLSPSGIVHQPRLAKEHATRRVPEDRKLIPNCDGVVGCYIRRVAP